MKWFKSNTCPQCGEWGDVYNIGENQYKCGKCGCEWLW